VCSRLHGAHPAPASPRSTGFPVPAAHCLSLPAVGRMMGRLRRPEHRHVLRINHKYKDKTHLIGLMFLDLQSVKCKNTDFIDTEGLSYFVSVHSGDHVEVRRVGDPAVHNQNLILNHCGQRQPAEDLLDELEDRLAVHLQKKGRTQFSSL